jgi:peptidoglycan/xylan/chitin deacetylase (PgdA/CDA1 family)
MPATPDRPASIRAGALLRSSPLLLGLAALHGVALAATIWRPAQWVAWILALAVLHLLVLLLVLQPRNPLFGPNLTRLPVAALQRREVAITFDDGPDAQVTLQVLDILDQFQAKASFFVVGNKLREYPQIARQIVARGHSLENHTASHALLFALFGVRGMQREIQSLQAEIEQIGGKAPRFFRPPAGFHSPLLVPLLGLLGLRLATWTRRGFDTRDRSPERVLGRLTRGLAAGDILLLHDGNSATDRQGARVVLQVLPRLLQEFVSRGLCPVSLEQAMQRSGPADGNGSR